ncbi:glycosyltransferase [Terrabacter sp. GCM10028922]|uniref:glycosyltransferase n=1 Tax=Terrabacter sp. GCM10028922 TaxID=3273428 RepID=UPI00360D12D4
MSPDAPLRALVITVVHHPEDARIRHRQIGALLDAGLRVTYAAPFAAHGVDLPDVPGLRPVDLPHAVARSRGEAFRAARRLLAHEAADHDVVLVHDPEIVAAAAGLGLDNLVWDVHEDTAAAIEAKPWVPQRARASLARAARAIERHAERRHDLILAEYAYADRFEREHVVVPNTVRVPGTVEPPGGSRAVYLGSLTMARGAATLLQAGRLLTVATRGEVKVEIIGAARDSRTAETLTWGVKRGHVVHHGFVPSARALPMLDGALAGLSLLEDRPNYRHSMPTKVIEYMAHGLPVVTTPLPLAADLVETAGCGIVVPFDDAEATATALIELSRDRERREAMGRAGHAYVREHYDWNVIGHDFVRHVTDLARRRRGEATGTSALPQHVDEPAPRRTGSTGSTGSTAWERRGLAV